MNIKYCGPALDYSGYGEANRHDIGALLSADIGVSVELTRHCLEVANFGPLGETISGLQDRALDYKFKILHTTPNIFGRFIEPDKYIIGRVFWETDKLPESFAKGAQLCDEIWTGSEYNRNAIIKAGVTKPIYIIPEAIETAKREYKPYLTSADGYKFYSIFEWTERKNPGALLTAFWQEFQNNEKVSLIIKTYVDNFTPKRRQELLQFIKNMKKRVDVKNYAPVYLYRNLLNRDQMYRFHNSFDCFVSAHRGEGWGIPQMEALLMEKPVISTNAGGIHEHLTHFKDAVLVPYEMVLLEGNSRNTEWYTNDQHWADIDVESLKQYMRYAYDHKQELQDMAKQGKRTVENKFNFATVGAMMKKRLEQIKRNNA